MSISPEQAQTDMTQAFACAAYFGHVCSSVHVRLSVPERAVVPECVRMQAEDANKCVSAINKLQASPREVPLGFASTLHAALARTPEPVRLGTHARACSPWHARQSLSA